MMRLVWSPFALADRDEIFSYIEADNPKAAAEIDERIAFAVRRLLRFPESGRPGRIAGTRELVVQRTPYIAVYAVTADKIRVLRVLHGARMWPEDMDEL
ncbi:putative toxin Y4kP [Bosea sp. 62]|nr:putative toxin Y4kP [Bosea sp. 7B]CAD5300217.1 putative toxin Y4kP [Bosea sp. 21B]CAD5300685.1 putative toxin Y4kP [Bosea sp. 46]VVT61919.1 putative toxin Y4kP [Bosea sp. EC-HK365B]VXB46319.1 putative toxin Y4kP [Bosea sp. 125]VXC75034.1 putative toxin Y4kP [Bosea sp. 62]VXC91291.1 putative toxin Y4kP [Bosea sp. 29B]VXC98775.1 putative toxin Y4kP [Bosea sp. 127]